MQYGITHQPLIATVSANRRKPDQVVAFIGEQICFFERGTLLPKPGEIAEVMITRVQQPKIQAGERAGFTDHGRLSGLLIQVVDPLRHMLVAIDGFECSGSMCRTTAHGRETHGLRPLTSEEMYPPKRPGESTQAWCARTRGSMWLTPGRSDIFVAENVNARFDRRDETPRRPTNVWVERAIVEEKGGCGVRVAGLTRTEDLRLAHLVRGAKPAAAVRIAA